MSETIDLGEVSQMIAKVDQKDPEYFSLILTDETGEKVTIRASQDAAKTLLSHLTGILYPRAAAQINSDTTTVKRFKGDLPTDVSYMAVALQSEQDPQIIRISCTSREAMWIIQLTHEVADDLWASLEDKLDHV